MAESSHQGIAVDVEGQTCPEDVCHYDADVRVYIQDKNFNDVLELGTLDIKLNTGKVLTKAKSEDKQDKRDAMKDFTFTATGLTKDGNPGPSSRKLQAGDRLVVEWLCAKGAVKESTVYCRPQLEIARGGYGTYGTDLSTTEYGQLWLYPGWPNCGGCFKW